MRILVCGGAGYIGSHMVKILNSQGHTVTIFDNLSTGHAQAAPAAQLFAGDLLDKESLARLFKAHNFEAVMHFSAKSLVGESMTNPSAYYTNNVIGTINLLDAMQAHQVHRFIFSSSAAIFGPPQQKTINEEHPCRPINPYGRTKLMVEHILKDYHHAYGIRSVSLRYFNAAGADPEGKLGESHTPETHLIPNILKSLINGHGGLKIFGNSYETPDGTCIRDYIHINDLCSAHLLALNFLDNNDGVFGFNLGNGNGFSILEVIAAAEQVTGHKIKFEYAPPREGDPARLVADSSLTRRLLGWKTQYTGIEEIISTAWNWHQKPRY